MSLRHFLERYFEFDSLGAAWRTEILAGCTTFMTMAYIVFVNPAILHEAGMPLAAVTAATCLSAAIGSFLMGADPATPSRWFPAWVSTPTSRTLWSKGWEFLGKPRWAPCSSPGWRFSC